MEQQPIARADKIMGNEISRKRCVQSPALARMENEMEWIDIETKKDVDALLERVEQFHDWYVAGFSYDPLARAEGGDLNLGRFKIDVDSLTVTFRWDCKSRGGEWPEVQLEFNGLLVFRFANFKDPDPIWHGRIEVTNRGWAFFDDDGVPFTDEERAHPENVNSGFLVVCDRIRWRPLAVVTADGPDWWDE